jgi:predicted O-methyltransferase YrrM
VPDERTLSRDSWKDDPWRKLPTSGGRVETMRNLAINSLRSSYLPVMLGKVKRRITQRPSPDRSAEAVKWCEAHVEDDAAFARERDPALWAEALAYAESLHEQARETLLSVKYHLGGGGHYALLYFLVRSVRPAVVVETGVAAGWSSEAILSALQVNANGALYSSDFPMFRLSDPESYIGILVRPEHRARWSLFTRGDAANLPAIVRRLGASPIDLVHYDSDKTAQGRHDALRVLAPHFHTGTVVVMDDIQDDLVFAELTRGRRSHVFRFERKFLGLIEWGTAGGAATSL